MIDKSENIDPDLYAVLHFNSSANHKRVKLFWIAFTAIFVYEIIPAYIFPLLNGVSVFCLASQKAPQHIVDIFTNLFGGTNGNEGLGLLSISFDWQYIGSAWVHVLFLSLVRANQNIRYMSLPLIQQGERLVLRGNHQKV